jgi:predicted dehydrogenase/threonine dehydrogenase-like Zn-dependent dehydrogenase
VKQVLQDIRDGRTLVEDVPAPLSRPGCLRIATAVSLVSAGTERTLADFARGSLLSKARQQPERVREVARKARADGLIATLEAVRAKLDQPMAVGYCNVGRVLEAGAGADGFAPGDRVVSNGRHAEVVVVGKQLCARIPDAVDDASAVFTVLGAIALQGVRLAAPALGETFVVTGLGLVGLMAVQILRANGCRVLGIDQDPERIALARAFGAVTADLSKGEDPLALAAALSQGRGVDGVLLTLSSTSSEPLAQAARMCRQRGRIVLVGVAGLALNRADFYEKELSFQVSCAYGPGRYDPDYEERGQDYPFGLVRWTEQRNFEAVLALMAESRLDVRPLISHRFDIAQAAQAYDLLVSATPSLGIVLDYPASAAQAQTTVVALTGAPAPAAQGSAAAVTGFIGAGDYGGRVLIKAFARAGAVLDTVVSATGVSAAWRGRRFGFRQTSSDPAAVLAAGGIDTVCIATRHDSHGSYVRATIRAGKHVFVEKPLCLTLAELDEIEADLAQAAQAGRARLLMVGFNRRFAPMVVKAKALLAAAPQPKAMVMTVNAGAVPAGHWTQDPAIGGGRLVGEACHFIDLLRHLAASPVTGFDVTRLGAGAPGGDVVSLTLRFACGSFGVINYLANGHKAYPKERLEIFSGGRVLVLDNYRKLSGFGWPGFSSMRALSPDKGQRACAAAFVAAVKSGAPSPIPLAEIIEVGRLAIQAADRAR